MLLKDQRALISGGAGDIGSYLVQEFLNDGCEVVVVDLHQEKLDELGEQFPNTIRVCCDLSDRGAIESTLGPILAEKPISILINNAGLIHSEPLVNLLSREDRKHSAEGWSKTISANLDTAFNLTSVVADSMVSSKTKGVIVNVSSVTWPGNIGQSAYSAAKSALNSMTVTWSKELGMFGIRCASVAPGFFDTNSTRVALSEATLKKWTKAVALNRLGDLKELYHALKFIVENDYYNGRVLEIDGGLRI